MQVHLETLIIVGDHTDNIERNKTNDKWNQFLNKDRFPDLISKFCILYLSH